jgi:hypothetical protein
MLHTHLHEKSHNSVRVVAGCQGIRTPRGRRMQRTRKFTTDLFGRYRKTVPMPTLFFGSLFFLSARKDAKARAFGLILDA